MSAELGVGVSIRMDDGTLIWSKRDTWAEVNEDLDGLFQTAAEVTKRRRGEGTGQVIQVPSPEEPTLSASQVEQALNAPEIRSTEEVVYDRCPKCGSLKDKKVPAGVSKKTNKPYNAFFACPTPGCPGR